VSSNVEKVDNEELVDDSNVQLSKSVSKPLISNMNVLITKEEVNEDIIEEVDDGSGESTEIVPT